MLLVVGVFMDTTKTVDRAGDLFRSPPVKKGNGLPKSLLYVMHAL